MMSKMSLSVRATAVLLVAAGASSCGGPSGSQATQATSSSVSYVSMVVKDLKYKAGDASQPKTRICYAVFAGPEGFPNDASKVVINGCQEVNSTVVSFLLEGLPPSEQGYAISLFQDMNGNDKLDTRSLFGAQVPSEPFGFTNNPTALRAPTYDEVRISPTKNGETVTIGMRSL